MNVDFADVSWRKDTMWLEPLLEAEVSDGQIVGGQLQEPVLWRFVTEWTQTPPSRRPSRSHGSAHH
jgi:hypothetical protein